MQIFRHDSIRKDLKNLKHFSAPEESLESWERLFYLKGIKETPGIEIFSGFGNQNIYKGRVIPLKENFGKSKGYRVIFQKINEASFKILVFSRHGIYKTEQELINIIKDRLET
ncbi:MAG: hypothetical protein WC822_04140 [Candidatus Paceibacterota bacterium]|jgi:hypothetical protein